MLVVALLFIVRYGSEMSGDERRAAWSSSPPRAAILLPIALVRFNTVSDSIGQGIRDMTFLFTDLTDSTAMYARIGDLPAFDLVRLHFDTLTTVARRHRGRVVKTIGDALMARFHDPAEAVQAGLEMF